MELWTTDIINAYIEDNTKELIYIISGPDFGKLQGHTLIISIVCMKLEVSD